MVLFQLLVQMHGAGLEVMHLTQYQRVRAIKFGRGIRKQRECFGAAFRAELLTLDTCLRALLKKEMRKCEH